MAYVNEHANRLLLPADCVPLSRRKSTEGKRDGKSKTSKASKAAKAASGGGGAVLTQTQLNAEHEKRLKATHVSGAALIGAVRACRCAFASSRLSRIAPSPTGDGSRPLTPALLPPPSLPPPPPPSFCSPSFQVAKLRATRASAAAACESLLRAEAAPQRRSLETLAARASALVRAMHDTARFAKGCEGAFTPRRAVIECAIANAVRYAKCVAKPAAAAAKERGSSGASAAHAGAKAEQDLGALDLKQHGADKQQP